MNELESKTPIQPVISTVQPETKATKETGEGPTNSQSSAQVYPPPKRQRDRCNCRPDQTPWWKYGMELAAILVGGFVAFIYWRQLDTMKNQLEMTDRPWIRDTALSVADMTWQGDYLGWAVTVHAYNAGHSVATRILPEVKLVAIQGADFIDYPRQEARKMCDHADATFSRISKDPPAGTSIFPGESHDFIPPYNVSLMPSEVDKKSFDGGAELGPSVMPMLVGCIVYTYPTSSNYHHTWFVYSLSHADIPAIPTTFFGIGKNISKDGVILTKTAQFAD